MFLALGPGAKQWLIEAAANGVTRMRVKTAAAVEHAALIRADEADAVLGLAAAARRFADDAVMSIIRNRPPAPDPRTWPSPIRPTRSSPEPGPGPPSPQPLKPGSPGGAREPGRSVHPQAGTDPRWSSRCLRSSRYRVVRLTPRSAATCPGIARP